MFSPIERITGTSAIRKYWGTSPNKVWFAEQANGIDYIALGRVDGVVDSSTLSGVLGVTTQSLLDKLTVRFTEPPIGSTIPLPYYIVAIQPGVDYYVASRAYLYDLTYHLYDI